MGERYEPARSSQVGIRGRFRLTRLLGKSLFRLSSSWSNEASPSTSRLLDLLSCHQTGLIRTTRLGTRWTTGRTLWSSRELTKLSSDAPFLALHSQSRRKATSNAHLALTVSAPNRGHSRTSSHVDAPS